MSQTIRTFHVTPGSDLDQLLETVKDSPIQLERDGVHFIVTRASKQPGTEHLSDEQIERSIAGIQRAAGAWSDIDAEAFKEYIRDRRRTSNRASIEL